jgi:hypothetical protein
MTKPFLVPYLHQKKFAFFVVVVRGLCRDPEPGIRRAQQERFGQKYL